MPKRIVRKNGWVRGFDWDSTAGAVTTISPGTTAFDWARWTSDHQDPAQNDLHIAPKTLVKTLLALQSETSAIASGADWQCFFGLITADSFDPGSFGGPDVPDASVGTHDWIAWLSWGAVNKQAGAVPYTTQFNANGGGHGMLEYSSQRRLPPNRGILWVFQYAGPGGTTASATFAIRMGLKGDVTAPGLGGG